jgi:drug/metabolite transporter (DMT)-like permease
MRAFVGVALASGAAPATAPVVVPVQRPILALGLRVLAAAVLATLLMLVKLTGESGVALPEIMFWRQAVGVPMLFGWLAANGGLARLRTRRLGSHFGRAAVGTINMTFNFGAAILLLPAESTTLGFTTPLFAVVLAALVMREHVGPYRWAAVALGFAGVLLTVQPSGGHMPPLGVACGLTAAFLIAVINYQIRDLGRTEEPISVVFWFATFGTAITALTLPFVTTAHSPRQWLLLIAIGVVGTVGQLLYSASLRLGAVSSLVVMDYTALFWATLYGWAIWDRLPPIATWLGAPLIVAAGLIIFAREHRLGKQRAVEELAGVKLDA